MSQFDRRSFIRAGSLGLAAVGLGGLTLRSDAAPTEPSGEARDYRDFLISVGVAEPGALEIPPAAAPAKFAATEDNILGPYYRPGAPFRGKITPPLEGGEVLVVRGRVWAFDTKKPLLSATLDIWQANAAGRYDNDDPNNPPKKNVFLNRARLRVDETGYYEYESIKPGKYQIGENAWRPPHIHYMVGAPGYKTLVTQLYFSGEAENKSDSFIRPSLVIDLATVKVSRGSFKLGTFDIVLAKS
jgi:catechol 1,2-dioxygenase